MFLIKYKMNENTKAISYINVDYEKTQQLYDNIFNIYDVNKDYILAYIFNNKHMKIKIFKKWRNMFSF